MSPQTQGPTLDVLTALAIDQRGRMAMTSVVDLEYWKPLTRISDERFTPGANVAMCKQTDDILTALAIDRDGCLQVASVARVEFWKPPVPISDAVFPPGVPVAMAKQTDGVLTALAVDKYGLLCVASVGGLEDWKKPVAISDPVFVPGTAIAMAKQTEGILTALAVDKDGRLCVASVGGVEDWKKPVAISDPVFPAGCPVAMAKQTEGILTALAVDIHGRLCVASVGGVEDWKKPVAISEPIFPPGCPVAMAKQTEGILTALAVDIHGRLCVASVGGVEDWKKPVAIRDAVLPLACPVAMAKQTRDVLTALAVGGDGVLRVASVAGLEDWKPPVGITGPVFPPKARVAMAKQVDGVDLATYLSQQPAMSGSPMTRRVVQLTGAGNQLNQTAQHGVEGVDLGANAELDGRLFFLFGDVPGTAGDSDWLAYTSDTLPGPDGFRLTSVNWPNSTTIRPFSIVGIGPLRRNQTPTGAFAYPGAGNLGQEQMFVFAFYNPEAHEPPPAVSLQRGSVLTKSRHPELGDDFEVIFSFSAIDPASGRFFQVAPWVIRNAYGDAWPTNGDGVILMGHGFPANDVHLAWMPLTLHEDPEKSQILYYPGGGSVRHWSPNEADAVTLFSTVGYTSLSLSWLPGPRRWLLLYSHASPGKLGPAYLPGAANKHNPNGPVLARFGETPWSWSEEIIIFDPLRENALGRFMHRPGCDELHKNPELLPSDPDLAYDGWPGYAYGPFNLNRYTEWDPQSRTVTLYYLMSTFAPYQVQLMRSQVKVA
jgi:hypothetical protein